MKKSVARGGIDYESSFGKVRSNDTIMKLHRTTPYYKRNRALVCSFFVRGQCTRGPECPYRHEMPVEGELSQQNIKDRYYGEIAFFLFPLRDKVIKLLFSQIDNENKTAPFGSPGVPLPLPPGQFYPPYYPQRMLTIGVPETTFLHATNSSIRP